MRRLGPFGATNLQIIPYDPTVPWGLKSWQTIPKMRFIVFGALELEGIVTGL